MTRSPARLLFVCAGNTCRSPMAAALAARVLPNATAESAAGLAPGDSVAQNAVLVVKELTGIDISPYRPRDIAEVDLTKFDRIIVLDGMVARDLATSVRSERMLVFEDIPDPFGGSIDEYRACAKVLTARIELLGEDEDAIASLRADIRRWQQLLPDAEPTYCQGVANMAAKLFEALLKKIVQERLVAAGGDLGTLLSEVKYQGDVQSIGRLPLGTVTQLFIKLAERGGELVEASWPPIRNSLTGIVEVRNETTHEIAPDRMLDSTRRLLGLIDEVLGSPEFVISTRR